MDTEEPKGSGRLRVRLDGYVDPRTRHGAFRVEDQAGRVLCRIREARNPQEAFALYWRSAGGTMPGATMSSKDLDRRISRARAGGAGHEAMRTPELPFEPAPPTEDVEELIEPEDNEQETGPAALQGRRPRTRRPLALVPQSDLFAAGTPDAVDAAIMAEPAADPEPEPQPEPDPEPEPQPEPEPEPEPEASPVEPAAATPPPEPPPPPAPPSPPADPEPRILSAEAVMLQRVDPRPLRPTDRSDSYLYHITNGPDAEAALRQGLVVSVSDPMILTERQGVSYWLSVLAEDYDYLIDGPADFVVLRLRRFAVEELLEPDPHATRSAGCPCYLLTGRRRTA